MSKVVEAGFLCPANPAHGPLRRREDVNRDAAWCGTWYDCPRCEASILLPSAALREALRHCRDPQSTLKERTDRCRCQATYVVVTVQEALLARFDGGRLVFPARVFWEGRRIIRMRCPLCGLDKELPPSVDTAVAGGSGARAEVPGTDSRARGESDS